ncbi:RHS repeat domain-containing protein [Microbacterium album]|uniref:Teneurin-like YD-shell domain-containing protein n=1 Tax=Microbacterium album TaxID=2053191 RepID=A0A917IIE7_9MICO|nr:RHS repeat-associated core domain-containing protein [Microbacterium album]GGH51013.1 hypothetical protein GCM10010921_30180 [Microbacterium album]
MTVDGELLAQTYYRHGTSQLTDVTFANGQWSTLGYDRHGRQISADLRDTNTEFPKDTHVATRSPAGRITELASFEDGDSLFPDLRGAEIHYDGAGRVIEWHGPDGIERYGYDEAECGFALAGRNTNRTSVSTPAGTRTYCYDEADRLIKGGSADALQYDDRGNTLATGWDRYAYDATSRLIAAFSDIKDGYTEYTRDPVHRVAQRVSWRDGAQTTAVYGYSGFGEHVTFLADTAGRVIERYVSLPGGVRVTLSGGTQRWAHADLIGNVAVVLDEHGDLVSERASYNPWGEGAPPRSQDGTAQPGFLGTDGRLTDLVDEFDPIIDMGARTYHPELGRFLNVDPVVGGCANDYVYVYGDPINSSDPKGTFSCWKDGVGWALSVAALGLGIASLAALGPAAFALGAGSLLLGGGAALLDIDACFARGKGDSCALLGIGLASIGLGAGGTLLRHWSAGTLLGLGSAATGTLPVLAPFQGSGGPRGSGGRAGTRC